MDDDKVYVLDSLYNYLSVIMTIQMSQIYRNSRNTENILGGLNVSIPSKLNKQILGSRNSGNIENILNVSIPSKLNKQILGSECGLFAIANLVEYCFGGYDEIIKGGTIAWEFSEMSTKFAILTHM